jgi:hypothetical protein
MVPSTSDPCERVETLVALFNRGSLDLPDGALDRNAIFRLNGVAYDETLGRPASDPLVRLLARGAGGYRFLVKAVRAALPDARLELSPPGWRTADTADACAGDGRLIGRLATGDTFGEAFQARVGFAAGGVVAIDVDMDPAAVSRLAAARAERAGR